MACKGVVTRVVSRYSHNSTCSVTGQYIVRSIDWNTLAGEWVSSIRTCEDTAHTLGLGNTLTLRALLCLLDVGLHSLLLLGSGHICNPLVLRRNNHKCYTENSVGTSGENLQFATLAICHLGIEEYLCTLRATNPVALNLLQRLAPLEAVETVQHTLCVCCNAEQPLLHTLLLHRVTAAHRQTILHLVICEYGAKCRTPVHHSVSTEGKTIVLQHLLLLSLALCGPLLCRECQLGGASGGDTLGTLLLEVCYEVGNRLSLLRCGVVVVSKHLEEGPLCPLIVLRLAGAYLTAPVIRETYLIQLLTIASDVLFGSHCRVLTCLNCILLGWQTKCVVAHWVQHIVATQALIARVDVRCDVTEWVTYVQTRARRVGEHIQYIEFWSRAVDLYLVDAALLPLLLPFGLNLFEIILHNSFILFLQSSCSLLAKSFR